jgi:two-component system, cell cycle sensor histidine kinase and response regulator CckA
VLDESFQPVLANRAAERLRPLLKNIRGLGDLPGEFGARDAEDGPLRGADQTHVARALRGEVIEGALTYAKNAAYPEGAWLRSNVLAVQLPGTTGRNIVAVIDDVTAEQRARAQTSSAERTLRVVLAAVPDAMIVVRDGKAVWWNARWKDFLGHDGPDAPAAGAEFTAWFHEADRARLASALEQAAWNAELGPVRVSAHLGDVSFLPAIATLEDFEGSPAVVVALRDVTVQSKVQAQLMETDRLASVGLLAHGVAHELNNPLAAVISNVETLRRAAAAGEVAAQDVEEALGDVAEAADRMRRIVRDISLFARHEDEALGVVDVAEMLKSSVRIAASGLRRQATVVVEDATGGIAQVAGNRAQLGQVFVNLIVNAAQAFSTPAAGNRVEVSVKRGPGGDVVVVVRDNGPGIPEQVQGRLFTPFFTTKAPGEGTGLGLSISRRIVTRHRGSIWFESQVGRGTAFFVRLPQLEADPAPAQAQARAAPSTLAPSARPRVLVVDDERLVLNAVQRLLAKDWLVTLEPSSQKARDRLLTAGERYDVVLCDVTMPPPDGPALFREVQSRRADLARRFVFVTGGAVDEAAQRFLSTCGQPVLPKPFDLATLLDRVETVLAAETGPNGD